MQRSPSHFNNNAKTLLGPVGTSERLDDNFPSLPPRVRFPPEPTKLTDVELL